MPKAVAEPTPQNDIILNGVEKLLGHLLNDLVNNLLLGTASRILGGDNSQPPGSGKSPCQVCQFIHQIAGKRPSVYEFSYNP